jgi:hypothetical protein
MRARAGLGYSIGSLTMSLIAATALPLPTWVLPVSASPPSPPLAVALPPLAVLSPW